MISGTEDGLFEEGLFPVMEAELPKPPSQTGMTSAQRSRIRELFGRLGVQNAASQFAVVEELLGIRIASVAEVTGAEATTLIRLLVSRVERNNSPVTGNAWDDRTEDTWIDRM